VGAQAGLAAAKEHAGARLGAVGNWDAAMAMIARKTPATIRLTQIQFVFDALPTVLPQVQAGKIRALGGAMATRARAMPDLPTLQEQGVAGYECYTWNAILAPAKTPAPIVARLSDAINKALADPVVFKHLQDAGVDPTPGSNPEKLAAFLKAELAKWAPIIQASGAHVD